MRQFRFALGVACTHCHGTEEQTGFDLRGVDFSLDIKPTKMKARAMLRMVDEINSKLLAKASNRSDLKLQVTCFTCHSGLQLPESIEARVERTIEKDSLAAAIADDRTVRERYYGSGAYNFKEQPLVEVAYILGEILEMDHNEGAEVLEISPAAFRQRLSRARRQISDFMEGRCGLVQPGNGCRCRKRIQPAIQLGRVNPRKLLFAHNAVQAKRFPEVLKEIRFLEKTRRAAALLRSHPDPVIQADFVPRLRKLLAGSR